MSRWAPVAFVAAVVLLIGCAVLVWLELQEAAALTGAAAVALGGSGDAARRSAAREAVKRHEREQIAAIEREAATRQARIDAAIVGGSPRKRNEALIEEAQRRRGEG